MALLLFLLTAEGDRNVGRLADSEHLLALAVIFLGFCVLAAAGGVGYVIWRTR
jgi:hypothetical protein